MIFLALQKGVHKELDNLPIFGNLPCEEY